LSFVLVLFPMLVPVPALLLLSAWRLKANPANYTLYA